MRGARIILLAFFHFVRFEQSGTLMEISSSRPIWICSICPLTAHTCCRAVAHVARWGLSAPEPRQAGHLICRNWPRGLKEFFPPISAQAWTLTDTYLRVYGWRVCVWHFEAVNTIIAVSLVHSAFINQCVQQCSLTLCNGSFLAAAQCLFQSDPTNTPACWLLVL